jgi:hypothetical protein
LAGKRKGNKVFTETEGTTSGNKKTSRNVLPEGVMPGAPISNVMRDDFGLDIPYETVPLPSRGLVYPVDYTLYAQETVDIRPMTAREEDILTSRALIKKGTVITHLIESCLMDKNIRANDLLAGDRNALMIALRITGYGSDYRAEVSCPECDTKSKFEFDLSELPITRLGIDPIEPGINLFEFELPYTKKKVKFKFLTGHDEEDMNRSSERRKKMGQLADSLVTSRLSHSIVEIAEVADKSKINHFIRNMPARDSRALRKFIDDNEPGIDMTSWFECSACGESTEMGVPLGASFFWPDAE